MDKFKAKINTNHNVKNSLKNTFKPPLKKLKQRNLLTFVDDNEINTWSNRCNLISYNETLNEPNDTTKN